MTCASLRWGGGNEGRVNEHQMSLLLSFPPPTHTHTTTTTTTNSVGRSVDDHRYHGGASTLLPVHVVVVVVVGLVHCTVQYAQRKRDTGKGGERDRQRWRGWAKREGRYRCRRRVVSTCVSFITRGNGRRRRRCCWGFFLLLLPSLLRPVRGLSPVIGPKEAEAKNTPTPFLSPLPSFFN